MEGALDLGGEVVDFGGDASLLEFLSEGLAGVSDAEVGSVGWWEAASCGGAEDAACLRESVYSEI